MALEPSGIALAAWSLPLQQQKQVILCWGSGAAVVMRIILTIVAVQLLSLPLKIMAGCCCGSRCS